MSTPAILERVIVREVKDPILISAFSSQEKGGATAPTTLSYATERCGAELIATFQAPSCYNHARLRPWVRRVGDQTVVQWPENNLYRVDSPEHTFLVLVGVEPTLNWPDFVEGIGDFALRQGVRTAVNLKSVSSIVPHTFESPVKAIYSQPELKDEFRFDELEDQDGPGDIGRILNLHLAALGCRTIDLYAFEPFYSASLSDAGAGLSFLKALKGGFDLNVDLDGLRQAADMQRKAIEFAISQSDELRQTVAALEEKVAATGLRRTDQPLLPQGDASPLDVDDVLSEARDILKDFNVRPLKQTDGGADESVHD